MRRSRRLGARPLGCDRATTAHWPPGCGARCRRAGRDARGARRALAVGRRDGALRRDQRDPAVFWCRALPRSASLAAGLAVSAWWLVFAAALVATGFRLSLKPARVAGSRWPAWRCSRWCSSICRLSMPSTVSARCSSSRSSPLARLSVLPLRAERSRTLIRRRLLACPTHLPAVRSPNRWSWPRSRRRSEFLPASVGSAVALRASRPSLARRRARCAREGAGRRGSRPVRRAAEPRRAHHDHPADPGRPRARRPIRKVELANGDEPASSSPRFRPGR